MSRDPNRLLFVLSARGKTTWKQYVEAVDFLSSHAPLDWHESGGTASHSSLLQSLQALGHCDVTYSDTGSVIEITPACLCRLPLAGLPKAVLVGARCLETCRQVVDTAKTTGGQVTVTVMKRPGPLGLLPDTVVVEAISEKALSEFGGTLGVAYLPVPPAWTIINWCGALPEVLEQLKYTYASSLNWPRYDYSAASLEFARTPSNSFPRFSRYRNPVTGLPLHLFFLHDSGAEVDPCWGKYMLLHLLKAAVSVYDDRRFALYVPVTAPLPALIARAVCLCSGQPPTHLKRDGLLPHISCSHWLVFSGVPPQIAMTAMAKAGQTPVTKDIGD